MTLKTIRIATRQSPLALWQANHIRSQLLTHWPQLHIELLPMITSGDKFLKDKLLAEGGKGLFVKELEEALLDGRADLAVHSSKDMPSKLPDGLQLGAICQRDNPFDALISMHYSSIDQLPQQAIVGTASLRRQAQLLAYRPDLHIKTLRGNINTRLAKLQAGDYDAIILAASGLERMGFADKITQILPKEIMLPTCAQGALCIEIRAADSALETLIAPLNDPLSALQVHTERKVNALLGGNCHVPLAVFCSTQPSAELLLEAKIFSADGQQCIKAEQRGPQDQAALLADYCSQMLLDQGGARMINATL
ncbi:MAG: hydroxymethylbilane synthase [Legionella sp.]